MGNRSVWTCIISVFLVIVLIICIIITSGSRIETDCPVRTDESFGKNDYRINLDSLAKNQPILWNPDTKQLIPGANGTLHLHHGQKMGISCPESSSNNLLSGHRESFVVSNDNGQLKHGKSVFDLPSYSCREQIKSSVLRTNKPCSGGQFLNIGYHDPYYGWINSSSSCFDEKSEMIRYTHFPLYPTKDNGYPRPNNFFKDDELYSGYSTREIKKLYSIEEQKRTFRNVLGSDTLINEKKKFSLNKGHVVARSFYNSIHQQISTFNYVNISPQWNSINSGNMNSIEQGLAKYVNETGKSIEIYAGVHGILQFEHSVTKEPMELFLDAKNKKFPIPKIFYFYVVEENIVLVVVNNPYVNDEHIEDYTFGCTNISNHPILNYMTWKKGKRFGLTYAFSPDEFSIKTGIYFEQKNSKNRSDFQFMY